MRRSLLVPVVVTLALAQAAAGGELKRGDMLSQANWQAARDLVPPEILRHYENGEYANVVEVWGEDVQKWSSAFNEGTRRNASQLALDAKGSIVDKATGKRPAYLVGFPFPDVRRDDPDAGIKILWNHYLYWWNNGNLHNYVQLHWVSPRGIDRSATQEVYFLYYQGQPKEFIPRNNPNDLLVQLLTTTVQPADMQGTTSLSWRYRDPETRDAVWAYVPALRRVRAVSPTNRSDGFLGSDMSQDDGPFFDGKAEDFVWRLAGEQDMLRLADPYSLKGEHHRVPVPGGGWRGVFKRIPMVGFQDPEWKGAPWAPVNLAMVRRPAWIIEGIPKDKYYLYGKVQLWIDKTTYQGAYNRKFSWQGAQMNTYTVFADPNSNYEAGDDWYGAGAVVYQGAENLKLNRATVISNPQTGGDPANDRRILLEPSFFDSQALVRFGK